MLKKLLSFTLAILIMIYMAVPVYAEDTVWLRCTAGDEGRMTIEWESTTAIKELRIYRSGDEFKSYTVGIPNKDAYTFTETDDGTYTYKVKLLGEKDKILASSDDYSVTGTGKPKIWLDFVDANKGEALTARVRNWVNIDNQGTTDLDLTKLMIRYFYTIDGEPGIVDGKFPNSGQQKAEESDGKLNPSKVYTEYPLERKNIQAKESIRMNFTKIPFDVTSNNGSVVADYVCDTYFAETSEKLNGGYTLKLQPAFDKKNLTNLEGETIRNYNLLNDYSYNNSNNIAVYYDGEKIWGNDPTVIAPKDLKGEYKDFKIELDWTDSPGATGYTVYRSDSRDGVFRKIAVKIPYSNYTDSAIELPNQSVGKKYFYKVVANYNNIVSDESNIAEVDVSELKAPANLTAKIVDIKNVELSWEASEYATQYNIYRSESAEGYYSPIKTGVTGTVFVDNTTTAEDIRKTYYYKVKAAAQNSGNLIESDFSDFAEATILNLPVPENLTARVVNTKNVELEWNEAQGAAGYKVYRSDSVDGVYKTIKVSSDNAYTDTSTTLEHNYKSYYYKVSAIYNIDGSMLESSKSGSASAVMPRSRLEAPQGLKAKQSGSDVILDWTASAGAVYYKIYRSEYEDKNFIEIASIDAVSVSTGKDITSYIDTSVPNVSDSVGKNYYYRVAAAYDDTDKSEDSNTANVMITVYIGGETEYWNWHCRVISSKGISKFVLGTYIPVSFTIILKQDVNDLSLCLNEHLITTNDLKNDNRNNLKTSIVSVNDGGKKKLIKVTLNEVTDIVSNVIIKDENNRDININGPFKKGDKVTVDFAIKTSADENVILDGIEKYYGDKYDMDFIIKANGDDIEKEAKTNSGKALNIIIEKPNKLK
ncbi:fibronectin type 3 domain-containing protein [Ruminiclostridium sufflavum DSM 19573]|uniref:Fibronectin type 3 domain-containing protein n=1 Tax=Ruminiclostridium sufflavum DSM 19573 TaxID=1121337 RepID=A0A318XIW4_9FIRM|nr:cellulose binding domain-containing protein [Ruminiclostridium sufflavum]PYG85638.1 fibronectin type 3 domain-containing protein [Ruminiclostridium sufflavum DSM 19573]